MSATVETIGQSCVNDRAIDSTKHATMKAECIATSDAV